MSKTIQRVMHFAQPREQVWQAITESATLAEWMFPNDFEPRVGHRFTFQVPANPKVNFDGLTVHCEVLECEEPSQLVFSWSAGELVDTKVSFRLEPDGQGTKLLFEHAGFNITQAFGEQAFKGAEYGWAMMLKQLGVVVAELVTQRVNMTDVAVNAAVELHDSEVIKLDVTTDSVIVHLAAYVHRSTGRPGIDAGTGWLQPVDMLFAVGVIEEQPDSLPCTLHDGAVSNGAEFEGLIPLPVSISSAVRFEAYTLSGERLVLQGTGLQLIAVGDGTFIETFTGVSVQP